MTSSQRLSASLTPLDVVLTALLHDLRPVGPIEIPLADALNCITADTVSFAAGPARRIAIADGWALRAHDLVGASSYSPLPLSAAPQWVEAGDAMPEAFDCVIDAGQVDQTGSIFQVLAEAIPGQGVRRVGGNIAPGTFVIDAGARVSPLHLLVARSEGLQELKVRRPRLAVVNIPAANGDTATATLIAEFARAAGAEVSCSEAAARDKRSVAGALETGSPCDLIVTVGGSGVGRTDETIAAIMECGEVFAHGIALQPGRTTAVGKMRGTTVIALSGAPDQALAAWWALALPALDRLSGRKAREADTLPLQRKIASTVGVAEIALLRNVSGAWMPLAVGDIPLEIIARAEAWLVVPAGSEGYAAGMLVDGYPLEN